MSEIREKKSQTQKDKYYQFYAQLNPEKIYPAAEGNKFRDLQSDIIQSKRPWNTQP